ncbi:hypothetical protein BVC80_1831g124 [Macleaya cordata]|uniref:Uncharacterized protein n=1 Tax=Macleaya cordata TaxID=56857 RepID=A0A200R7A4_MACCD|nr:hypothetical protein BVC80_1831g124 [Macleaya cordata]
MRDGSMSNKNIGQGASSMFGFGTVRTQLEETKQSLQIAREEGMLMANCLISLKEELEETKRELQQIKSIKQQQQQQQQQQEYYSEKQPIHSSEFEFVKFVENVNTKPETEPPPTIDDDNEPLVMEFQNKLCVKFADPPSLAHHVMMNSEEGYDEVLVEQSRHPPLNTIMNNNSKKKKKKLTMIPGLIGGIFSHKKKKKVGIQKTAFPNDRAP